MGYCSENRLSPMTQWRQNELEFGHTPPPPRRGEQDGNWSSFLPSFLPPLVVLPSRQKGQKGREGGRAAFLCKHQKCMRHARGSARSQSVSPFPFGSFSTLEHGVTTCTAGSYWDGSVQGIEYDASKGGLPGKTSGRVRALVIRTPLAHCV